MRQLLIQKKPEQTIMAWLEDGRLVEIQAEQLQGKQAAGSIYKGRVVNVLPGMQAAFVDIGQGKNAFLYIDDLLQPNGGERAAAVKPSITELVRVGEQLLVQIVKEPIDGKGARITTNLALPGRSLVYMPRGGYVGISKKIASEQDRARLRAAGESLRQPEEGIILRTAAQHASAEELAQDVLRLRRTWEDIAGAAADCEAPIALYSGATLAQRILSELLTDGPDELWVDDEPIYDAVAELLRQAAAELLPRLRLHAEESDLLESRDVTGQLERAFARRVRLPSGAELVWDQTEALTVIDVNTGKFVGTDTLEDTVYQVNLEAAQAIARLLRLRDAGGIILVDFIDMTEEQHRSAVKQQFEEALKADKTQSHVLGWTRLGLLEMTRKKTRESAISRLYETCPACRGRGKRYAGLGNVGSSGPGKR
ncbi:Rne/Rng family ribonuclease [Paenibacillus sp. 1P07SE]|uniref:Rne/Rng family ribonuclease n=1 Tax=Paenibacillus sp. 1P07SE TaxID=3132209 RepID=UPI0039A6ACFC